MTTGYAQLERCTGRLQASGMDRPIRADQLSAHIHPQCADCARRFAADAPRWISPPALTTGAVCPRRVTA